MTPLRYCRTLLATGALLCLIADAGAVPAQDPETVFRAAAQAARLGTVPPPPSGVRDLAWSELSPRGWDARNTLRRWAVADLEHDDAKIRTAAAGIRREWDLAPTVNPPANTAVRLTAFMLPLGNGKQAARTAILSPYTVSLAPYDGDGAVTPMPPANQMVLVTFNREVPVSMFRYPIWVSGKISLQPTSTRHGRVAYRMADATWEPYPYGKYPLPQYQWQR